MLDHNRPGQDRILLGIRRGLGLQICLDYHRSVSSLERAPCDVPVLSPFFEARIQVCPDYSLVKLRAPDVFQTVEGILVTVIFNEAEATGGFVKPVEAHDKSFNLATPKRFPINITSTAYSRAGSLLCKELMDLLLRGVERAAKRLARVIQQYSNQLTYRLPT